MRWLLDRPTRRCRARRVLALLLIAACESPTGLIPFPVGAYRFDPQADTYAEWWAQVEACSGRRGSLAAISWYLVPGSRNVLVIDGREYTGVYYSKGNRIVLAENGVYWGEGVRHEMLHALLRVEGHPREYFIDRCGGVVA